MNEVYCPNVDSVWNGLVWKEVKIDHLQDSYERYYPVSIPLYQKMKL